MMLRRCLLELRDPVGLCGAAEEEWARRQTSLSPHFQFNSYLLSILSGKGRRLRRDHIGSERWEDWSDLP
jgi:hypothetical protein